MDEITLGAREAPVRAENEQPGDEKIPQRRWCLEIRVSRIWGCYRMGQLKRLERKS